MSTPVAVFTYNRPEHARRALTTLARCHRLAECQVHIYCDGARSAAHQARVEASRRTVHALASSLNARVVERAENLGLAHSIVAAVTELVQAYGRVIVVEDDLILSPSFLDFMLQALDKYRDAEQVFQISGYLFPLEPMPALPAFFLPLSTTWGWATWERAWQNFSWNATDADLLLADRDARRRFCLDDSYPYATMLEDRLAGRNDSWGILWWYTVFQAKAQVLYPQRSLVQNAGFDGSGTHSGDSQVLQRSLHTEVGQVNITSPLPFPEAIATEATVWAQVKKYLNDQQDELHSASLPRRLWRRLKASLLDRSS